MKKTLGYKKGNEKGVTAIGWSKERKEEKWGGCEWKKKKSCKRVWHSLPSAQFSSQKSFHPSVTTV